MKFVQDTSTSSSIWALWNKVPLKNTNIVHFESSLVFIFDWDDTLLCTSYLSALHFMDLSPEIKELLNKLDDICIKLI